MSATDSDSLSGMKQTVLCTSVQWTCGHYTTTIGVAPRYCPVCTGQTDVKLLEARKASPFVEYNGTTVNGRWGMTT